MKISNISVRGYRTIKEELNFDLDQAITLVGPNNSGKTNTLKAIHYFSTGYVQRRKIFKNKYTS
ncbi:AAA family ATPase [Thalassobaculum sp. OXR-137]|uniref:AAA family ATPase n=1 Tax=Thalassobaculum sp. OXR-137 TaxID=3100173 RepID=UPI0039FC868B